MEEEKQISPSILILNTEISSIDKEKINKQLEKINKEILLLKREYLRIKNRKEKIIEQKEKKEKELEEMKITKELKLIQSDYVSKRFLEKEGGTFEGWIKSKSNY